MPRPLAGCSETLKCFSEASATALQNLRVKLLSAAALHWSA